MRCDGCGCCDTRLTRKRDYFVTIKGIKYHIHRFWYRCRHCGKSLQSVDKKIVGGIIET